MTQLDFDQLQAAQDRPLYDEDEEHAGILHKPQGHAYEGSIKEVGSTEEAQGLFVDPEFEYRGAIRHGHEEQGISVVFWRLRPAADR